MSLHLQNEEFISNMDTSETISVESSTASTHELQVEHDLVAGCFGTLGSLGTACGSAGCFGTFGCFG